MPFLLLLKKEITPYIMLKGFTKVLGKIFGTKYDRDIKEYAPQVDAIIQEYNKLQGLSLDQLRGKTIEFREAIHNHLQGINDDIAALKSQATEEADFDTKESLYEQVDEAIKERDKHLEEILLDIRPAAFAVVKETARRFTENLTLRVKATDHDRELAAKSKKGYVTIEGDEAVWQNSWKAAGGEITWNMVHYDVQLIGGMVLHDGKIAEMQTGEGKTLVATLPAYLNGLSGYGVHVVTVNDYLARRDCEWIGPLLEFLFLTIDCIDNYRPHSDDRKAAYNCDITYGTNNEFGFDYLRDNMVRSKEEMVQGKHHFAMIDEIDSILVDDARTPLIISGPIPKGDQQEYKPLRPKVERLIDAQRKMVTQYLAEAKKQFKAGNLGYDEGQAGLLLLRAFRGLPRYRPLIKFLGEDGVKVEMQKAEAFYMQEQSKNMHLADEPLLFTIEEKNNNVDLTDNGAEFLAKGSDDTEFFVLDDITEQVMEIEANETMPEDEKSDAIAEASQKYTEKAQRLHSVSQLLKAYTLFEKDVEYVVMDSAVKIVDEQTGRIMEGRRFSDGLHQALEAKEDVKIGDLTQTYASITLQNYFRMHHKLAGMTGTAETEAGEFWEIYKLDVVVIPTNRPIQRDDREDMVFRTEREKLNAVIDEVVNLSNAGRPVLVGTTTVEISEKLSRLLQMRGIKHNTLNAKQHEREATVVAEAGKAGNVTIATNMAGRGTDIKISDEVKAAGGLAIIGTERHDSRRVDRQLRGRAGRQGDPGSSQFYVSLDDKLMRLFGSERIAKLMDRMGYEEGEVIQHSMVTKSIERAQKKVEENNFGTRKRLLEYDDVMNIQREAIYKRRKNALEGDRLTVDLNGMFLNLTEELVMLHKNGGDFDSFREESIRVMGLIPDLDETFFKESGLAEIFEQYNTQVQAAYAGKSERVREVLLPICTQVLENEGHRYKRIAVPFTDGRTNALHIAATLEPAVESEGKSIMTDIEKTITLALLDDLWKDHLRDMDELKVSVQSAQFKQKDPLVEYKIEAFEFFSRFMSEVNRAVVSYLMKGHLVFQSNERTLEQAQEQKTDMSKVRANKASSDGGGTQTQRSARAAAEGANQRKQVETFRRDGKKIGRNEPCPCGSGKKYKQCHGRA
ncbi:MAG: preprotein translocase subunit SecA [Saprospiraceae bacterium]